MNDLVKPTQKHIEKSHVAYYEYYRGLTYTQLRCEAQECLTRNQINGLMNSSRIKAVNICKRLHKIGNAKSRFN